MSTFSLSLSIYAVDDFSVSSRSLTLISIGFLKALVPFTPIKSTISPRTFTPYWALPIVLPNCKATLSASTAVIKPSKTNPDNFWAIACALSTPAFSNFLTDSTKSLPASVVINPVPKSDWFGS